MLKSEELQLGKVGVEMTIKGVFQPIFAPVQACLEVFGTLSPQLLCNKRTYRRTPNHL